MLSEITYTCEYCNSKYTTREACEKCEVSHSHNVNLHKKLEDALSVSTVYYHYDNQLSILYFYKIEHLCENTSLPECILRVKSLEIHLNKIFYWYEHQVFDAFRTSYFIANIESGIWSPITKKNKVYKDIQEIIKLKESEETTLSNNDLFKQYNSCINPYVFNVEKEFKDLFIDSENIIQDVKDVKQEWKK